METSVYEEAGHKGLAIFASLFVKKPTGEVVDQDILSRIHEIIEFCPIQNHGLCSCYFRLSVFPIVLNMISIVAIALIAY